MTTLAQIMGRRWGDIAPDVTLAYARLFDHPGRLADVAFFPDRGHSSPLAQRVAYYDGFRSAIFHVRHLVAWSGGSAANLSKVVEKTDWPKGDPNDLALRDLCSECFGRSNYTISGDPVLTCFNAGKLLFFDCLCTRLQLDPYSIPKASNPQHKE